MHSDFELTSIFQLPSAQPVYSGKMYIEGKISRSNASYKTAHELAGPGMMMAMGPQKSLALQQMADSTYSMYFGVAVPEDFYQHRDGDAAEKTEAVRQLMLSSDKFYASWAPQLKAIAADAEGPFRAWTLHYLKPKEVGWKRDAAPGVTLIGDAAHLSTPFVGEGVNCAMYDAMSLAKCLLQVFERAPDLENAQEVSLEKALASYEAGMFERGRDLIRRSAESEAIIFSEKAVENVLGFVDGKNEDLLYDVKTSKDKHA
jgi:2-polyprenyl-6-methoxyphenol hydroxylase-like FAD-dependent oxidoreductase